jgi:hypothetical protein
MKAMDVMALSSNLYQGVSAIVALIIFICWLRPQTFSFLIDKGSMYPSLGRQGQYTALIVSTWGFVTLTLTGDMSEYYAGLYMLAWAGAQFGSVWLKLKGGQSTSSTSSTTSSVTNTPPA